MLNTMKMSMRYIEIYLITPHFSEPFLLLLSFCMTILLNGSYAFLLHDVGVRIVDNNCNHQQSQNCYPNFYDYANYEWLVVFTTNPIKTIRYHST